MSDAPADSGGRSDRLQPRSRSAHGRRSGGSLQRRGRQLAQARRLSQLAFLGGFFFLLLTAEIPSLPEHGVELTDKLPYPASWFLQLDPLLGLATVLSTWNLFEGMLWGLAIVLLTLLLGRVFCGWLCPLGTLQHLTSWLGRRLLPTIRRRQRVQVNRYRPAMRLKFYLLAGLLASALLTSMLVGLLDPLSLLTRSLALSIIPAVDESARVMLEALQQSGVPLLQRLGDVGLDLRPSLLPVKTARVDGGWLLGLLLMALLVLSVWRPRFWCRHVCPLGALLGTTARPALLGLQKDEAACTGCNRCLEACQGACEPQGGAAWRSAECHVCFNCQAACPEEALSFRPLASRKATRTDADLQRRVLVGSLAAGAAAIPLLRSSAGFAGRRGAGAHPELIRPPGALAEEEFLARCIKCGACMKVCPTGALHPTLTQAGLEGLWTPVLIPRIGYCEPSCTLCGEVCPTGAIRRLTREEKAGHDELPPVRIGTAFYDRGRCLPWAMGTPCIVCEEWCPASPKAIWLESVTVLDRDGKPVSLQRPHVDPARCTGCGACENACPVKDRPAIRVTSAGETRHPHNRFLLVDRRRR